jgi:hypothetical protein
MRHATASDGVLRALGARMQPDDRWRLPLLRTTHAIIQGDLRQADRQLATVEAFAHDDELDEVALAMTLARRGAARLRLDHVDEAIDVLERGLALARALDIPACIAVVALLLARALDVRARPGDRERAVVLAAEAQQLTAQCTLELRAASTEP